MPMNSEPRLAAINVTDLAILARLRLLLSLIGRGPGGSRADDGSGVTDTATPPRRASRHLCDHVLTATG